METIKILREKSGAGMVDCQKALAETNGDIEKSVEILRKKGIAKMAKRSERQAGEGIIKVLLNDAGNEGYIVQINSETDFVARNSKFQEFANQIINIIKINQPGNLDELMNFSLEQGTVKENLAALSGIIGEKLEIKRFDILSSQGTVSAYTHLGGRIGVLVSLDKAGAKDLAYDMAMQIAAANPKYISPESVPSEEIQKEKEIYREQLAQEGKSENIIDKILTGKIDKYLADVCLTKQEFIKDDKKTVADVLNGAKVEKIIRYSL